MIERNNKLMNRKKQRIKISSMYDLQVALNNEGYDISKFDEENFIESLSKYFKINTNVIKRLYSCINNTDVTYRADNVEDLLDYVEKMMLFEDEHRNLCKKIKKVKMLHIDRIEYDRVPSSQDDVDDIVKAISEIKPKISKRISEEEKSRLEFLEEEIETDYLYAKDIELLKRVILCENDKVNESYNEETKVRTLTIEIPAVINDHYIKAKKGSVEYHQYLTNNVKRMERLIRNLDKYMLLDGDMEDTYKIDQSDALQDSINIAVAVFNNKEFKAVSGSDEVENYCPAPQEGNAVFKSSKVNKLGKLGIGYNRVNDSEKKIFEAIHKGIEDKELKDVGELILFSKWEPCPSCYYVISQFSKKHPNIKIQVKFDKKYGE